MNSAIGDLTLTLPAYAPDAFSSGFMVNRDVSGRLTVNAAKLENVTVIGNSELDLHIEAEIGLDLFLPDLTDSTIEIVGTSEGLDPSWLPKLNIWNNNGSQFDVSLESADTIVVGGDSSANDISVTAQSTKGYAEISSMSGADNITLRVDDVGEFFRIWSSDLRGSTISLTVGDVAGFSVFSAVRGYRSGASECPAA